MLVLVLLTLLPLLNAQNNSPVIKQVIKQCTPNIDPIGQFCIDVTSKDCFELTGKLTVSGYPVFTRTVSISQLINTVAKRPRGSPVDYCQDLSSLNIPTPTPCSLCVSVDNLQIQGDDLNFCGKAQVNCSFGIKRDIPIPCLNITDCAIFGCKNGCNNGVCSPTGVCVCQAGYYGNDCSLSINGNCLKSSTTAASTCWKFAFPDCNSMTITTTAGAQPSQSVNQTSVTLIPCQSVPNSQCKLCLDAENVHTAGNKLVGCPVIKDNCNGMTAVRHEVDCTTLATSDTLACTGDPPVDSMGGWSTTSKIVLIVLVVVLVVSILAFGGHFAYRKYQEWQQQVSFQPLPTAEVVEAVPLAQATEDL